VNEPTRNARIPVLDKGNEDRSTRRVKNLSYILVAIVIVSAVSIIAPVALNNADSRDEGNSSASTAWAPVGDREAVYKFDHWGEEYLKNEAWNKTDYGYSATTPIDMANLGHHGVFVANSTRTNGNPTGMGVSDWFNGSGAPREGYGEYAIRTDHFPYIMSNNPNSGETTTIDTATALDWICWTPYRLTGAVKNESMGRTGSDAQHAWHAWFVPHLGPDSQSGGYINASYYGTYLTDKEIAAIKAPNQLDNGLHYAQWYYGCGGNWLSGTNDGYFYELQGKIQYSRQAAIAYLGWPGTGNITAWWTGGAGATVESAWLANWYKNGSDPKKPTGANTVDPNATWGWMNPYTNYEYDMNTSQLFNLKLKLDINNSTANTITIRLYSVSWGLECSVMRMMERCNATGWWMNNSPEVRSPGKNIRGSMIDYHEDLYWNISADPQRSNMTFRMVTTYRLTAWEDPSSSVFMGGWMLETFHTDYIGNGPGVLVTNPPKFWSYLSPFNRYDPDNILSATGSATDRTTNSSVPGTRRYHKNATYWTTPIVKNFSKYECFIYDLNASHWGMGDRDFIAFNPNWVASNYPQTIPNNIASPHSGVNNFTSNLYWGKLKLGDFCTPFPIVKNWKSGAYNNLTSVLNISGGSTAAGTVGIYMDNYALSGRDYWSSYSVGGLAGGRIWAHGMPFIMLDVVPIEDYEITITGTHMVSMVDIVKVVATNGTGMNGTQAVLKNPFNSNGAWNGTVVLTATDGAWGANGSSHTFVPSDNGIWWTSITWSAIGTQTITATDHTNSTTSFTDIQTRASVGVIAFIPEFSEVLIPIVGMMAMFFVLKAKRRKDEGEQ